MADWPMAGANAQRTGYQSAETLVPGFSVAWRHRFAGVDQVAVEKLYPQVGAIVSSSHVLVATLMGNLHSFAFSTTTKTLEWTAAIGAPIMSTPCADGTKVYVADCYGRLTAVTLSTGAIAWGPTQITDYGPIQGHLLLADGLLIVGGADGVLYGVNPSTGSISWEYPAGAPILHGAAGDGAGKAVVGVMDGTVACVNTTTGAEVWRTAALSYAAGFKDYWPVISGSKVLIRPWLQLPVSADGVTTPIRAIEVSDWQVDASMTTALANYDASPSSYAKSLAVLDLADGSDDVTNQVIHYLWYGVMHGAPPPPVIEASGDLVIPAIIPTTITGSTVNGAVWVTVDLTTRKVNGLLAPTGVPLTNRNRDENMVASACSNGVAFMHIQEANAQFTGFFRQVEQTLHSMQFGANTSRLHNNTQGAGANQAAISGGMVYHLAHPHTLVAIKGS